MTASTAPKKQGKKKVKKEEVESSEEEEIDGGQSGMVLDDSTEYSEEDMADEDFTGSYPFAEHQPKVRGL